MAAKRCLVTNQLLKTDLSLWREVSDRSWKYGWLERILKAHRLPPGCGYEFSIRMATHELENRPCYACRHFEFPGREWETTANLVMSELHREGYTTKGVTVTHTRTSIPGWCLLLDGQADGTEKRKDNRCRGRSWSRRNGREYLYDEVYLRREQLYLPFMIGGKDEEKGSS